MCKAVIEKGVEEGNKRQAPAVCQVSIVIVSLNPGCGVTRWQPPHPTLFPPRKMEALLGNVTCLR